MIGLADLIAPDRIFPDLRRGSKRQVLQGLAEAASGDTGIEERVILEALIEREKLGTTGLGNGIAIPHARLNELESLTGYFAHLHEPVDFDALDGQAVDLVFLLLAPTASAADHLKALARIARILRSPAAARTLREEDDPDALYATLIEAGSADG